MKKKLMGFFLLFSMIFVSGTIVSGAENLVKNSGFENKNAGEWIFTGKDNANRGEIQAVSYASGLNAAGITIIEKTKQSASWTQTTSIADDKAIANKLTIWYSAPDNGCSVKVLYSGTANSKKADKGSVEIQLAPTSSWEKVSKDLEVPQGTKFITISLQANETGNYFFDDISLTRESRNFSSKPNQLLFIGLRSVVTGIAREDLTDLLKKALKDNGWENFSLADWNDITPELLKSAKAVVIVSTPRRNIITPKDEAIARLLTDYVKAGGGILITQNMLQMLSDLNLTKYLGEQFGLNILLEKTIPPAKYTWKLGDWDTDVYSYTDKISGPVAEGVKGILYPSSIQWLMFHGVLPFAPDPSWQIVLSAGPDSKSIIKFTGLEKIDKFTRNSGFEKDVPLAGIKEFGQGRAAYIGIISSSIFSRPTASPEDKKLYEEYMINGAKGHPSDLLKFYLNTFRWIAANSDKIENAPLNMEKINEPVLSAKWKLHKGIIGARTNYSSGKSSPDEYVKKAKDAGLDFIVFLEDFASLKSIGLENLKKDCARLSDDKFLAIPGITYENSDGNHQYVFSDSLDLPSEILLDPAGKKLLVYGKEIENAQTKLSDFQWIHTTMNFENSSGWYLFKENPYPHYDARLVNSMAVATQENGKTLEYRPDCYGESSRNGQFLWPIALTLMTNSDEIEFIKNGTYFCNIVGAAGTKQLKEFLTRANPRSARHMYPGIPPFGTISISEGPVIKLKVPRADTDVQGDIYNKNLQMWPIDLAVNSDNGLKEVILLDGDEVIRRFKCDREKDFEYHTLINKERQKHIWVRATDINGKEAINRSLQCDSWLLRETQCADRCNQLIDSRQKRADGTPFFVSYGGDTCTPDKGPWNGRIRPVGCFLFDPKLGISKSYDGSPEGHPQCFLSPSVEYDGNKPKQLGWEKELIAGKEGAPHCRAYREVASSEVLIGNSILDGTFPLWADKVIHVWGTIYPVLKPEFMKTVARRTLYLIKPDGISAYLCEQEFELLKDIPVKKDQLSFISLGTIQCRGGKPQVFSSEKMLGPKAYQFNKGDYATFLDSPFGSLAVYSLSDGIELEDKGAIFTIGIRPTAENTKAGAKIKVKLLLVGMHKLVQDPAKLAEEIRSNYGINRTASYTVKCDNGKVTAQEYRLDLEAEEDSCFTGDISGISELPGNLGSAVHGMNDNWTAFFRQENENGSKTRIIPVEKGIAYFVLRDDDDGKKIFAGHPIVADTPELVLNVSRSKDWKNWVLEIHNPTDKNISSHIRNSKFIKGIVFDEKIDIPAGTSRFRDLGPAND